MLTFDAVRQTLDKMADRYRAGIRDAFSCHPSCAIFAKAVVDNIEAEGGPCPRLLGEEDGVSLTFMLDDKKVFYGIYEDEVDVFAFSKAHFGAALNDDRERPST